MDLTSIWENIAGQKPMFLAAAGSVGLGVTLILTAGIAQLRRFRTRTRQAAPSEAPIPAARVEGIPPSVISQVEPTPNQDLRLLLARLRAAADKLERSRASVFMNPAIPADSSLKKVPSGVDYIFRAGTG